MYAELEKGLPTESTEHADSSSFEFSVPSVANSPSAVKAAICEVTVKWCMEDFGERLRSLVLTGSLARDEATFVREGEGWTVLGDAEFLLVIHERAPLPSASRLSALREKIESALLQSQVVCHISLAATHSGYLLKMRPHIFGYELRTCGQVIWGKSAILGLIPAFSPSDIPLEDAWRLLSNRMIELLEVASSVPCSLSSGAYSTMKLYLDMATSFLLFQGVYEPTYRRREARLRSLAENATNQDGCPFLPLRHFSERVTACTEFKLGTRGPSERSANAEWASTSPVSWEEISVHARALWRWELVRLLRCKGATCHTPSGSPEPGETPTPSAETRVSDRELLRKWMRVQPLGQRLRGWAYVLRKCGWYRSWREWPHWLRLGWQASPRYWVYAAAGELFFKLGDLLAPAQELGIANVDLERLRSWLPRLEGSRESGNGRNKRVSPRPAALPLWPPPNSLSRALLREEAWRNLASEIAWNYHEFLQGTRA